MAKKPTKTEQTAPLQLKKKRTARHLVEGGYSYKPGQSGNPAGRPKGARSRFTEDFYRDLAEDWQEHGKEAMQRVREQDPSTYLRVAASLLPKDINITKDSASLDKFLDGLNDEQLDELITGLRSLGAAGIEAAAKKTPQPTGTKPNSVH